MEVEAYEEDDARSTPSSTASFTSLGLKDVTFSYEETVPVLEHFSVDIPRSSITAFTGPSGCGKSTALKLLLGLYQLNNGSVYPVNRSLFAYVPQGSDLIRGTIREVVAFGDKDAMQETDRIWNALTVACGADFVRELEEGLDTLLGEQGTGLSEGQMQRLSIARAVFADRPVLLLDEATSALDAETEAQLLKNLKALKDKTIIIVTHRPAALEIADKVVEF